MANKKSKNPKDERLLVCIDSQTKTKLEKFAESQDRSMSYVVRMALESFMRETQPSQIQN